MRYLAILGLTLLLISCALDPANYYTQSVAGWRGASVNSLVRSWGTPDIRMPGPDNTTLYIYHIQSYRQYNNRVAPSIGVNNTGGRPVVVVNPNTSNALSNGAMALTCTATFEVNTRGTIIHTASQGNGCYGGRGFATQRQ